MVISHIFRQGVRSASYIIRRNIPENVLLKRSFFKNVWQVLLTEKRKMSAYEGDGKTVGFIINKKNADVLLINAVMLEGFVMASGAELVGSMILFPHSVISWNISRAEDVSEDSLVLFKLLEPKIDILVFGYGTRKDYTPEVEKKFKQLCKKLELRYEALPTEDAIGLYNFLAEERRFVAAALIPPTYLDMLKFERKKNIYLEDEDDEELVGITSNEVQSKLIK